MTEVAFLKQNARKWKQMEQFLSGADATDPDQLADLFQEITDDLSYSQTFYPGSRTTQYLNDLARQLHQRIYRNKREDRGRFRRFWARELPLLFAEARTELWISLVALLLGVTIGAFSAANDESFVRLIMGDGYVNMTLENIEKGDPLAVYKDTDPLTMFVRITVNNIMVSLYAFVAGLFFSLGTVVILFRNGVMLGAFQQFFHRYSLLGQSFLTIYIHGALEISAIVIAGAAGLVVGNSILFPGTFTRGQSFRNGARKGLKMVIGLAPVFIAAGFLESFVTRFTGMPLWLSLVIILGSFAAVFWYVVWYPMQLKREGL
ncbi:MAG TPA: stage II sporulation protein M [Calditrichia bacterium]|nr:stage II sporulation protein M [Calditrichota bacterium]HQU72606.1 stage II sporulation protein M [Calditrichia bacterium]HQV30987.1 stage II sporulation protein M [Calditrichia bacterium]